MPTRVIDVELGAESFLFRFGKTDVPLCGCSYGDALDKGDVFECGQQTVSATTLGTYKPDVAKLKMRRSVWTSLVLPKLPKNGFGNYRFPVTIIGNHPEIGAFNDKLSPAYIVKVSEAGIEGGSNKGDILELELKVIQIYWNGKTINQIKGVPGSGTLTL